MRTRLSAVTLGLALFACGTSPRERSADTNDGGAPAIIPSCNNLYFPDPRGMAACFPSENDVLSPEAAMTVVGAGDGCGLHFLGSSTTGLTSWEFEAESGRRVWGGFYVEGLPDSLLSAGDAVLLKRRFFRAPAEHIDLTPMRGYFAIERDNASVVFYLFSVAPDPPLFPDFEITPDEFECGGRMDTECGGRRRMRVTANGESAVLAMGESAELAGYVFRSGGMSDNTTCDPRTVSGMPIDYMLGGYKLPE